MGSSLTLNITEIVLQDLEEQAMERLLQLPLYYSVTSCRRPVDYFLSKELAPRRDYGRGL